MFLSCPMMICPVAESEIVTSSMYLCFETHTKSNPQKDITKWTFNTPGSAGARTFVQFPAQQRNASHFYKYSGTKKNTFTMIMEVTHRGLWVWGQILYLYPGILSLSVSACHIWWWGGDCNGGPTFSWPSSIMHPASLLFVVWVQARNTLH